MRRVRAALKAVVLVALVAALIPIWFVHHVVTRALGARRRGRSVEIDRIDAADTAVDVAIDAGEPVIIEGLLDSLGVGDAATPAGLERIAGDQRIQVTAYDATAPYFLYSGGYDTSAVDRREMRVHDFLRMMFDDGVEPGTVVYQLFGIRSLDGETATVLDRFDQGVRKLSGHPTEPRFSGVWVGSPGAVTPLHHDAWPGLLFQTHGTKRVAMYRPSDRTNLYFRLPLRGAGRWSDLPGRSAEASTKDFPRLRRAVRYVGELRPGDALYIPPFWAHEMEAIEANVSVPFRFAGPRTSYLNPGFLRPASEMLRKQLDVVAAR
ncbi:MAG: cupin-like domain-containing protein [Ilumatobacteraceae bacterium]